MWSSELHKTQVRKSAREGKSNIYSLFDARKEKAAQHRLLLVKRLNCFELPVLMKGDSDECVNIFITSELLSSGQPEVNITCTELCSVLLTRPAHISEMDLFAVVRDFWCFTTTYFFYCWVTLLGMKLATNRREQEASYIRSRLLITLLITPHKLDLCEV